MSKKTAKKSTKKIIKKTSKQSTRKSVDPVKAFLAARKAPAHVIKTELPGLVSAWGRAVGKLAGKDEVDRDDYLNDLDGRQLIAEVLEVATDDQIESIDDALELADEAFEELTKKVATCVWGAKVAKTSKWSAKKNPWYFAVPKEGKLV